MNKDRTVSEYLIEQLSSHGIRDIFGIPGDYVLGLFDMLERSQIKVINTSDEQGAGFAADAYARINGIGAVCITYCVGGLKIANTTAQAFAEKSPVIVVSGSPGINERVKNPLLHHKVRDFDTQKKIFEEITIASTVIDDLRTAMGEIDRVIHAVEKNKLPGYIEIPRDMVNKVIDPSYVHKDIEAESDQDILAEAVEESVSMINSAKQPVLLAGIELHRFGLQAQFVELVEKLNIPFASTIMNKSAIPESHPNYMGVYEGSLGHDKVCSYVESSDCLVMLGALMTDFNLGLFTAHLDPKKAISANKNKVAIKYHHYEDIKLDDYLAGLLQANIESSLKDDFPHPDRPEVFKPETGKKITMRRLFQKLNFVLDKNMVLLPEIGEGLFGSLDLFMECGNPLIASGYYSSLGFSVPGALGVQIADKKLRPLVLVGDGAFQMTGVELSSIARYNLNPIVVVLNNKGYGTERPMMDGAFNDLHPWNFSAMAQLLGTGKSFDVNTEDELEQALEEAISYTESFSLIDVHLEIEDRTPVMERLTARLAERIKKKPKN